MTVGDLLNEFKKFSVDGMHANTVLTHIKKLKNTNIAEIKNQIRNYDRKTIKKAIQLLKDEGCIEVKGNEIIFKKEC
jgi:hypothetical protein